MIGDRISPVDAAFYAMDDALRDPATVPLEYNPMGYKTGLSVTLEDLERLFFVMAKAAHLFRLYDGPAPTHWADTWKQVVGRCAAICQQASMNYLSLCIDSGLKMIGERRVREASWDYMAALFRDWPARSGSIGRTEPASITAAAGIDTVETTSKAVESANGAKTGKPLFYLKTAFSREELCSIFADLVAGGFIDGRDPDALADFLNCFDPAAERQGRITWIKRGKNSFLNKMAICDFLRLFGITERRDFREYARAIFGETLSKSTLTNCAIGSIERDALRTIIDR